MKQLSDKISYGISFIAGLIKEEDLVTEAVITFAVLLFLIVILQQ